MKRCDCCGKHKPIAQVLGVWHWCAICAEKLEMARHMVLDADERKRRKKAK